MLSLTLIRRTLRDYGLLWFAVCTLLFVFSVLFMYAIHATPIGQQGGDFLKMPFVRRVLTVMLGSDPVVMLTPSVVSSFIFTHPLMWSLTVIFCLSLLSGTIAGEIDRGTMDLLATLPLSRGSIYNSLGVVGIAMALPMCWVVWLGVCAGKRIAGATEVNTDLLIRVTWHLCATQAFIVSFSLAISAACQRRGTAVAIAFFIVFYAFVLNFLRSMWSGLDPLRWTNFLNYFQLMPIVRDQAYRWNDIAVLILASIAWWIGGLIWFTRRDIPAR